MNRLILPITLIAMLVTISGATTANTVFQRVGIPSNTPWQIYISSAYNTTFNITLVTTANSITTNALTTCTSIFLSLSSCAYSHTYLYVAGYSIGGEYTYVHNYLFGLSSAGSNIIVNFTPINNTVNVSYSSCSYNQSICIPVIGNLAVNTTNLQNHVLGPPFSANLTIYINPAGYYEYIVQNSSLGDSAATKLPQSLYLNTQPGQLTNQLNLTFFGKQYELGNLDTVTSNQLINSKSGGTIFYSGLIDISPIEYDMLGGNLTPQTFANFVYGNSGYFYNSTLFYNVTTNTKKISAVANLFEWTINTGLDLFGGGLLQFSNSGGYAGFPYSEVSTSAILSVPPMLNSIPPQALNYPIYVSYAYPNTLCQIGELNLGICIESGQKGMLDFNNYIDGVYAPSILMSQFLGTDVPLILGFALIILIIKKINGE